jgi:type VI secretion system protein ImpA
MPLDEFEKLVASTPLESLLGTSKSIDVCLQAMEDSQPLFEERFGPEYSPSYGKLRSILEEIRRAVAGFVRSKGEAEPAAAPAAAASHPTAEPPNEYTPREEGSADESAVQRDEFVPAPQRRPERKITGIVPADLDEATARVAAVAAFWREQDAYNPAPYLMLRGMRWGEVRAQGALDPGLFAPPATDVRVQLKKMLSEGSYAEAIEIAESAMAEPCGRAWLDLQRYVVTACEGQGYSAIAEAIRSQLRAYLRDYPDLLTSTLLDDTPTANAETIAWCKEITAAGEQEAAPVW